MLLTFDVCVDGDYAFSEQHVEMRRLPSVLDELAEEGGWRLVSTFPCAHPGTYYIPFGPTGGNRKRLAADEVIAFVFDNREVHQ